MSSVAAMKQKTHSSRSRIRILGPEAGPAPAPVLKPEGIGFFFWALLVFSYFFSLQGLSFIVRGLLFSAGA